MLTETFVSSNSKFVDFFGSPRKINKRMVELTWISNTHTFHPKMVTIKFRTDRLCNKEKKYFRVKRVLLKSGILLTNGLYYKSYTIVKDDVSVVSK